MSMTDDLENDYKKTLYRTYNTTKAKFKVYKST